MASSTQSPLSDDPFLRDVPDVDGWRMLAPVALYARIGHGGMGYVYLGRHLELEVDVAVKCMKPSLVDEDGQFEARFRREAQLAAQLAHQNLVRVYELRRAHGLNYLVLEFVDGETVRDRVARKGPLSEDEAATILLGAARGLAQAHRHREVIVHRDVKPENILLSRDGAVKVTDLGIAKALESTNIDMVSTMIPIGTPTYMAPEQWSDLKRVAPATDVWALGVTLYFMLTGQTPVQAKTTHELATKICNEPFPDVRQFRSDLSEPLWRILHTCTRRDSAKRFADAELLANELALFLGTRSTSLADKDAGSLKAKGASPKSPPTHVLEKMRGLMSGEQTPPPSVSSRRHWAWIGAGVLLSVGIASAYLIANAQRTADVVLDQVLQENRLYTNASSLSVSGKTRTAGIKSLKFKRNGRVLSDLSVGENGRFETDLILKPDTTELIEFIVGDGDPFSFEIVQDATPPGLELLEPARAESRTKSSSVGVRVKVDDANLKWVKLGSTALTNGGAGNIWSADGVTLSKDGLNPLEIVALDLAGNSRTLHLSIVLDNQGPTLRESRPLQSESLRPGSDVTIALDFDEPLAGASIDGKKALIADARASGAVVAPAQAGTWIVPWEATDLAGNSRLGSLTFSCKDTPAPLASRIVLEPALPAERVLYSKETTLALRGRIENPSDKQIRFELNGIASSHDLVDGNAIRLDPALPPDSKSHLKLSCGEAWLEFDVIQDSIDPSLEILSPAAGARRTRESSIDIAARLDDANPAQVTLDARALELGSDGLWHADAVELPSQDGTREFTLTASDKSGRAKAFALTLVRDTRPPDCTSVTPGANEMLDTGATVAVILGFDEALSQVTLDGKQMAVAGTTASLQLSVPDGKGPIKLHWSASDLVNNTASGDVSFKRHFSTPVAAHCPPGWKAIDSAPGFGGWMKKVQEPKSKITFLLVEPGGFSMGSPAGEDHRNQDEQSHPVEITRPFYLAEAEVTQAQYERVAGENPSAMKGPDLPVEQVDWNASRQFCRAIGCDLPTEAQWEFACRAGTTTPFSFGAAINKTQANFNAEPRQTTSCKAHPANPWGFLDMHGNVWEWCLDGYDANFYATGPVKDPLAPADNAALRAVRGGGFGDWARSVRSAVRRGIAPDRSGNDLGFRPAMSLAP